MRRKFLQKHFNIANVKFFTTEYSSHYSSSDEEQDEEENKNEENEGNLM